MISNDASVSLEVNPKPEQNTEKKRKFARKNKNRTIGSNLSGSKEGEKSDEILKKSENIPEIPKTGIFLDIQGVIKEGTFPEGDQIFCKYDIVYGKEWKVISGQDSGQSQHACLGEGSTCYFVWNMPFQIRLNSENISNWPQLVISCYYPDFLGREILKAYGTCYIPTTNGIHERTLSMFCPISSYSFNTVMEILFGQKAELINAPKILAEGDGREILRTKSEGNIKIRFDIHLDNLKENGFDTE